MSKHITRSPRAVITRSMRADVAIGDVTLPVAARCIVHVQNTSAARRSFRHYCSQHGIHIADGGEPCGESDYCPVTERFLTVSYEVYSASRSAIGRLTECSFLSGTQTFQYVMSGRADTTIREDGSVRVTAPGSGPEKIRSSGKTKLRQHTLNECNTEIGTRPVSERCEVIGNERVSTVGKFTV